MQLQHHRNTNTNTLGRWMRCAKTNITCAYIDIDSNMSCRSALMHLGLPQRLFIYRLAAEQTHVTVRTVHIYYAARHDIRSSAADIDKYANCVNHFCRTHILVNSMKQRSFSACISPQCIRACQAYKLILWCANTQSLSMSFVALMGIDHFASPHGSGANAACEISLIAFGRLHQYLLQI